MSLNWIVICVLGSLSLLVISCGIIEFLVSKLQQRHRPGPDGCVAEESTQGRFMPACSFTIEPPDRSFILKIEEVDTDQISEESTV